MADTIVINSGPLITLARMEAFHIVEKLPYQFITPEEVVDEITARRSDWLAIRFPAEIKVVRLAAPRIESLFSTLDSGEAAVIQFALENDISSVCLDERKARRIAAANRLSLVGSLGLLARAKTLGIISEMRPLINKARSAGVYYSNNLIDKFLEEFHE